MDSNRAWVRREKLVYIGREPPAHAHVGGGTTNQSQSNCYDWDWDWDWLMGTS